MAINSLLAKLGTSDAIEPRLDLAARVAEFDFKKFGRAQPHLDPAELGALNAKLLHQTQIETVDKARLPKGATRAFWEAVRPNLERVADAAHWCQVCAGEIVPTFAPEDAGYLAKAAELLPPEPFDVTTWKSWTDRVAAATGRKGRALFHPLRLALTAREQGPELRALLPLIGRERALDRLQGNYLATAAHFAASILPHEDRSALPFAGDPRPRAPGGGRGAVMAVVQAARHRLLGVDAGQGQGDGGRRRPRRRRRQDRAAQAGQREVQYSITHITHGLSPAATSRAATAVIDLQNCRPQQPGGGGLRPGGGRAAVHGRRRACLGVRHQRAPWAPKIPSRRRRRSGSTCASTGATVILDQCVALFGPRGSEANPQAQRVSSTRSGSRKVMARPSVCP